MIIEIIKPSSETFSLDEAFKLMHCMVKPKKTLFKNMPHGITGIIQGVLDIDDEIELVVRFTDDLRRYNKEGFHKDLILENPTQ